MNCLKKKLSLLFLLSVLHIPTLYSMEKEDQGDVTLISNDGKKFTTKRKYVFNQSGLIKDMLKEQDDEDEETPELPMPNIHSLNLPAIIELMKKEYKLKRKKGKKQKEKLAEFIEKKAKEKGWRMLKFMRLMEAANYLNAPLLLKALAYIIAQHKIKKKILQKFPRDLFFVIQGQYIERFYRTPVKIFEEKTIEDLKKEKLYKKAININEDGKMFVPYYEEKKIKIGQPVKMSLHVKNLFDFHIACGLSDRTIKIWNTRTGKCPRTFRGPEGDVLSVAFSPDGGYIASGSTDRTVRIWDVQSGECLNVLKGHKGFVFSVAFHPDGEYIASGSADKTVRLWNVKTGECEKIFEGHEDKVHSVAFSPFRPDGEYIASGSADKTVRLWSIKTGKCLKILKGHEDNINSVAFSPNEKHIASGSYQTIKLWDIKTENCVKTLKGHEGEVKSIAFSPTGNHIASAGDYDRTVRLWSVKTGKCLKIFKGPGILQWDIPGHVGNVVSVAFSPNGKYIASGSTDNSVILWNVKEGEFVKKIEYSHSIVHSVAFYPFPLRLFSQQRNTKKFFHFSQ